DPLHGAGRRPAGLKAPVITPARLVQRRRAVFLFGLAAVWVVGSRGSQVHRMPAPPSQASARSWPRPSSFYQQCFSRLQVGDEAGEVAPFQSNPESGDLLGPAGHTNDPGNPPELRPRDPH